VTGRRSNQLSYAPEREHKCSLPGVRLVTYRSGPDERAGLLRGETVVDLGPSLRELLPASDLAARVEEVAGAEVPLADVQLLPPIPDPEKIVCIGLNYAPHAAEAGIEPPSSPTFFGKYRNALASPGAEIPLPAASSKVDFEAEVAVVIGWPATDVDESDALDHVAGYTLLNDLSARDLQFATPQWMPGKVFDFSAPMGPALVTRDEAGDHDAIEIALDLNGERMQEDSTASLIFSIPQLVSHLSSLMTLTPGDVIATGTPAGVGSTRDPRIWLKPGDRMEISSPQLGELVTTLRA
jgi:2-keto-4-pentenoate hydratase/2-oxohepta-3-ene-1,7-dioic acid hydratase in catechol pathway